MYFIIFSLTVGFFFLNLFKTFLFDKENIFFTKKIQNIMFHLYLKNQNDYIVRRMDNPIIFNTYFKVQN